jgi:hypothetical protein
VVRFKVVTCLGSVLPPGLFILYAYACALSECASAALGLAHKHMLLYAAPSYTVTAECALHEWGVLSTSAKNVVMARRLGCLPLRVVGLFAMLSLCCVWHGRTSLCVCERACVRCPGRRDCWPCKEATLFTAYAKESVLRLWG